MKGESSTFKCQNCSAPLGTADGARLRLHAKDEHTGELNPVVFDKPVSLWCGNCRRKRVWVPDKKAETRAA